MSTWLYLIYVVLKYFRGNCFMILILDIGISNIGSVKNALDFLELRHKFLKNTKDIKKADKVIIPGNGNYGEGLKKYVS